MTGPRGKSSFAKQLGISASTYAYYESCRVPPADILVRIADLAGADLRWLLTGEAGGRNVPADHPALQRAAALLASCPDAAAPLTAFLDILSASLRFPAKTPAEQTAFPSARPESPPRLETPGEAWIPILGRSAAGVPHFWSAGDQAGTTLLEDLITRHANRPAECIRPAAVSSEDAGDCRAVQIVTLRSQAEDAPAEFLSAPRVKARHGDAFALRIDGESMAPDIRHGDLVVLSPSVPAADGRPAVVQLAGQIGATCKLYRRQGDQVHLIPVNERFDPQAVPAGRVQWALRVLASVRPADAPRAPDKGEP